MWIGLVLGLWLSGVVHADELTPPYFNLAEGRKITASATCGEGIEGPELYCKLVGANDEHDVDVNVIQGQFCYECDPTRPDKRHPPEYAVDGMETWWQSPPLSRGMKYNEVNLTIDLGQEFHVAYVFIRMGNSPRPGLWILEKSADYGKTWSPWQYFSDSPAECEALFGKETLQPITRDDSVICTTEYSKIVPLEGGEIPISLLNNRPSANHYFNSSVLQEWTRATNIRFRFLRTKNLLGHLMSVARQDPTVTRRYFYSIKDISIGGRCMCNGHADTCDIQDPADPNILLCRCQHNTCGAKCHTCCPGYEQKAWRQSKNNDPFICEPCNCFQHSNECIYDPEVEKKGLSLDIHGRYEGGGVCQNCQHNTEGINCNKCKPTYYRPYNKYWNETDVCQPCNCDYYYSTGNCAEGTGRCECKKEYNPPNCDSCSFGYYDYPTCKPCDCHLNGTRNLQCEAFDGQCPCLHNFGGKYCRECQDQYYGFPECKACECNPDGSISPVCNKESGNCTCKNNYAGKQCDQCQDGYYAYPSCIYCNCDVKGTREGICDKDSGVCLCKEGYGGARCDMCVPGYFGYPDCKPCNCSTIGSADTVCDITGKCSCLVNFAGKRCDQCSPGYYQYPECLSCSCSSFGSIGLSCDGNGICQCHRNFDGEKCDMCKEGFYNYPTCEDCNCHPAGVVAGFAGCGFVPAGELCQCKERVHGRICDKCKPLYWNLSPVNPQGCEECNCHLPGVLGGIAVCDGDNGQCVCKPSVVSRRCTECADGTYNLQEDSLFGCEDCGCDIGGSQSNICDKLSGQCPCNSRVTGRTCKEPLQAHYFPTLYQYQYEVEDGRTPANTPVRYSYDEQVFPNYSWKGYAVFSLLQKEILQDLYIQKPSLYRMVLRYLNKNNADVHGNIKIIPENPSDNEQELPSILFKNNSEPSLVTVSGIPLVMNPGRWTVHIKIDSNLFLDYFVLLPEDFYLATILNEQVDSPCIVHERKLCKDYTYPNVSYFDTVWGSNGFVLTDGSKESLEKFFEDDNHLYRANVNTRVPLLDDEQSEITYNISINKPGPYTVVVNYVTPVTDKRSHTIKTEVLVDNSIINGQVILYSCPYTTVCRQALTDDTGIGIYQVNGKWISVTLKGNNSNVGIHSLVAIPQQSWSLDYVKPKPVCIRKDGDCVQATFPTPPESKKLQFEQDTQDNFTAPVITLNTTGYVFLNPQENTVSLQGKVAQPGYYVFIVHYYQPNYPEYKLDVFIQNGQLYESKLPVNHCPSLSGCRTTIVQQDGNPRFSLTEDFAITIKEPDNKNVYLDYILVVPADLYNERILIEDKFDRTGEFISTCGSNNFNIDTSVEGFCRDSVFSITAGYNSGALPCQCDFDGSTSFECDPFGGQCPCKDNIIGRRCEACKTGYYGFPDCKPCNCPTTAHCEPVTGQCICPTNVIGERCDQCRPYTYGYDPIIGCEECGCNVFGVVGDLQCDLYNGSCACKPNIVGRKCDVCKAGHFAFPYCEQCECEWRGTTEDICDQQTAECFCKKNVRGPQCNFCAEGTYNLQATNPDGCSECFCFGKTTRCMSSNYLTINIVNMKNWSLVAINETSDLEVTPLNLTLAQPDATIVGADFTSIDITNKTAYFSAPLEYLGNKMTAYGGLLNYSIYYTIISKGRAVSGADIILEGADSYLKHESLEQPPSNSEFTFTLQLIEDNFQLPNNIPAKREHLMVVLQNLKAIYIRATYWTKSVTTSLSTVLLEDAIPPPPEKYFEDYHTAVNVEQCLCPPNYQGLSCEECAPGYYRISSGPHGGYCVPCQCNGHSNECDVNTGVCLNCNHHTRGDHCEFCDVGYHGNALQGTPMDCLICACPLPTMSNNFASACDVSSDGERISCDCNEGYFGARCQSCANGYYGRPEVQGDYCKPCQCSGNINPNEPGSCDTVTGECLRCLNNTFGAACALCAPGYFGDAVNLKDCQACVCDKLGTDHCDSYTGECICKPNVIGEKCDTCAYEHYGFQSGQGCLPCECGEASESGQCADVDGQCRCKQGVAGRTCDRCAAGYWNYTVDGCVSCGCKSEYALGLSCDDQTGKCVCLPGVIGEKCDQCPYRWVFIPDYGCTKCDSCIDNLLDDMDELALKLHPMVLEFDKAQWSFFTSRRLIHLNDTFNKLYPKIHNLDKNKTDIAPIVAELEALEQNSKAINRKVNYSLDTSETLVNESERLRKDATVALNTIRQANDDAQKAVDEINQLSKRLGEGEGPRLDAAVQQAESALKEIKVYNLTEREEASFAELEKVDQLLDDILDFSEPVQGEDEKLAALKINLADIDNRVSDLTNHTQYALGKAIEAENIIAKSGKDRILKKFDNIDSLTQDSETNLKNAEELKANASAHFQDATASYRNLIGIPLQLKNNNNDLNATLEKNEAIIEELNEMRPVVQEHADNLTERAQELDGLLTETRDLSTGAITAANAYKNIVDAIEDAREAADNGYNAADEAAELLLGTENKTGEAGQRSAKLLQTAHELRFNQSYLDPLLEENKMVYRPLQEQSNKNKELLDNIDKLLKQQPAPVQEALKNVSKQAEKAGAYAASINDIVNREFQKLEDNKVIAKQIPNDAINATTSLNQVEKQLNTINEKLPLVTEGIQQLPEKQQKIDEISNDIQKNIDKLNAQIALAREVANRIKVGVEFTPSTTLELRNPPNLNDLSTSTQITGYFKTSNPHGMLLYLGNQPGTNLRRTKTDDFMSLIIQNGYPVLIMDVGNGIAQVVNSKFVADDKWYQFIIDRTGQNVKLSIREELGNGEEKIHTKEEVLEGPYSIFNLDKDKSRLCVGGCGENFKMQQEIPYSSFEGAIEDLVVGDIPIGLWNFIEGNDNNRGANARTELVNLKPSTGFRFNGHGHAVISARAYSIRQRLDIQLKFKTSEETGLLFLLGKDNTFIDLELRNGKVLYQYNLGGSTKTWYTTETYNDGEWHKISAIRDKMEGRLFVDDKEITNHNSANVGGTTIDSVEKVYFGGYPGSHKYSDVASAHFDGCIDDVFINGNPVDLSQNMQAYGVTPGCPDKFARLVSFTQNGYIKRDKLPVVNNFKMSLKFKTKKQDGLIFYAADKTQDSSISLSLSDGNLVLISQKIELRSKNLFNDSEWHVVTVVHNDTFLRLDYDDYGHEVTDSAPPSLHIIHGDLYIGGLPRSITPKAGTVASSAPFVGCIADATLNGTVVNFAGSTEKFGEILGRCILDKTNLTDVDIFPAVSLPPLPPIESYTTIDPYNLPESPFQEVTTRRGDGGYDAGARPVQPEEVATSIPEQPPLRIGQPPTTTPAPPKLESCALPEEPAVQESPAGSYRFGAKYSRLEYNTTRGRYRKNFDFSIEFKTVEKEGVILYASDGTHDTYIALFLRNGHVSFVIRDKQKKPVEIVSDREYNDDSWHLVEISRQGPNAKLVIDDYSLDSDLPAIGDKKIDINIPFYIGGLREGDYIQNSQNITDSFIGCLRNFRMNNRSMDNPVEYNGVISCSEKVELGTFFGKGGGYIKLKDRFKVGLELDVRLDIKPRNQSGILVAVHGRHDYLVLEMFNGIMKLTVENGRGPITTTFQPSNPYYFCDGNWHSIQAVKSKSVVTLSVDNTFTNPGVGDHRSASTDTGGSLFLGGHRLIHKARGLLSRTPYIGCIRNVFINKEPVQILPEMAVGQVAVGYCPTN